MRAIIFDIERNSYVDGPGIRTTVFFKGCNLKCAWCHNPESQSAKKEFLFYKDKCTGCRRCDDVTVDHKNFMCYNDAKEICGKEYTVDEVLKKILKDKTFYDNSGGGVTFSGGECMLQIDFLEEILKECKKNGIHTAIDTAGHVPYRYFERIIPYTDMFLYDVKCLDRDTHKLYTGVGNELILENLAALLQTKKDIWVRIPIITGVNCTSDEMTKIRELLKQSGYPKKVELLPYHAMGEHKYAALAKEAPIFSAPSEEKLKELKKIFE